MRTGFFRQRQLSFEEGIFRLALNKPAAKRNAAVIGSKTLELGRFI